MSEELLTVGETSRSEEETKKERKKREREINGYGEEGGSENIWKKRKEQKADKTESYRREMTRLTKA
jgi:hypothetical protein